MKIAIDAGHGMSNRTPGVFDPGAVSAGFREADIALGYAKGLRGALQALGIGSWMTREDNNTPCPVGQRARQAEAAGCTAFVSLHLNAFPSREAAGVEVLYRDVDKDAPLAGRLQRRLVEVSRFPDRAAKIRTDLAVLKFKAGPAVLIELGFISNPTERARMLDNQFRVAITQAVAFVLREVLAPGSVPPPPAPVPDVLQFEGRMSTFGGPRDLGVKPDEGLALINPVHLEEPRIRALFLDKQPPGTTGLARRLNPDRYYFACRFPYEKLTVADRARWKAHLRGALARVMNPRTGVTLEAVPVDWGPHETTGRAVDLSPGLAAALDLKTDDQVVVTVSAPPESAS